MLDLTPLCKKDFGFFCSCVLGQKISKMHRSWIDAIMHDKKHLCIVSARGHLKTTILSIYFPLWVMYKSQTKTNELDEVLVVIESATKEQSGEIMAHIKNTIEYNDVLREALMPETTQTKWNQSEIVLKNGHRIKSVTFGDAIRGKHPNYCICDDVLTAESTNTEAAKETYFSAVFPIGQGKDVKHIVVGTPMSFIDLLAELENSPTFTTIKCPAVVTNESGEWVAPQLPELFSLEKLRDIRATIPAHTWAREYMVTPLAQEAAMFPAEALKRAVLLDYPAPTKDELEGQQDFLGCDIALSGGGRADYSVFTHIRSVPNHPLLMVAQHRFKGMCSEKQIDFIKKLHKQYKFSKILIEKRGLSVAMSETLENDDETGMITEGFITNEKNKEEILGNLELLFRDNKLKLIDSNELLQELSYFGIKRKQDGKYTFEGLGQHDDMVIALALATFAAKSYGSYSIVGMGRTDGKFEVPAYSLEKPADIFFGFIDSPTGPS